MESLFSQSSRGPSRQPAGPRRYVAVALERGIERTAKHSPAPASAASPHAASPSIAGTLTYSTTDAALQAGDRVKVPLGRGDASAAGIVVLVGGEELLGGLRPGRIKPIAARLGRVVNAELLDLARWMAAYYVCPLGMVLASIVPAAVKKQTGLKREVLLAPAAATTDPAVKLTKPLAAAWARVLALGAARWPMSPEEVFRACREVDAEGQKPVVSVGALRRLTELGLLQRAERSLAPAIAQGDDGREHGQRVGVGPEVPGLNVDQAATVTAISATLDRFGVHLIRGVTGSGKTEVYLRLIERVIALGKRAIVLVPEIALTPQTSRRFLQRFGSRRVAVLHSALSAGQRHAHWAACAAGEVDVVVGARSAVFAPLPNLGIIVVDEEHDSSYKQDQLPRYHARDLAIKRGQSIGCPVVLGSATPSLESWANARAAAVVPAQTPSPKRPDGLRLAGGENPPAPSKYTLHTLPTRATGAALPRVEVVDLALERKRRAQEGGWRDQHLNLLGPTLEAALAETLRAGEQAMLLLNRRGYANYVSCPDQRCGWAMRCSQCDATMVYHLLRTPGKAASREQGFLRCHHCLAENARPRVCPQCSRNINTFGLGTQRVEEELQRKFAETHGLRSEPGSAGEPVTMLRLDSDSMTTARSYFEALDRFARGEIRLLLGTQMIAKGLDFPGVTLVGVINADTSLNLPDFRAAERTFQLVSQVAGRAGRGNKPGRVIVQTMEPGAPCIRLAASHDYVTFADQELACRARVGLPPVGRLVRVVCRDEDHAAAEAAARVVADGLRAEIDALGPRAGRTLLRGPMACPVSRIANHYRFAVELLAGSRGVIQHVLAALRAKGGLHSDAHTAVDVDPVSLL